MATTWTYSIIEAGVWIDPPETLADAHPTERAPLTAALVGALAGLPLLIRAYALDLPILQARVAAAGQPMRAVPAAEAGFHWLDVRCADAGLLPVLLTSWGIEQPALLGVKPAGDEVDWQAMLDVRAAAVARGGNQRAGPFALPPAASLPADRLLLYAIDEHLVIARPDPTNVVAALQHVASTHNYRLARTE